MSTTGGEKFSVYVYFRTVKYVRGIEQIWDKYDDDQKKLYSQESEIEGEEGSVRS